LVFPDAWKETILSVPVYNWHWQLWYNLAEPIVLQQGTRIECPAHFDTRRTILRIRTRPICDMGTTELDEMMVGFFNLKFEATRSAKELIATEGAIHVH
jgi:hypothetical protein